MSERRFRTRNGSDPIANEIVSHRTIKGENTVEGGVENDWTTNDGVPEEDRERTNSWRSRVSPPQLLLELASDSGVRR